MIPNLSVRHATIAHLVLLAEVAPERSDVTTAVTKFDPRSRDANKKKHVHLKISRHLDQVRDLVLNRGAAPYVASTVEQYLRTPIWETAVKPRTQAQLQKAAKGGKKRARHPGAQQTDAQPGTAATARPAEGASERAKMRRVETGETGADLVRWSCGRCG